jgi:hypothetical protein
MDVDSIFINIIFILWAITLLGTAVDFLIGMRHIRPWWVRWYVSGMLVMTAAMMVIAALNS